MLFFSFIQILIEFSVSKSGHPDQTPQNVASDLGLHCFPMSNKKDARLILVNIKESCSNTVTHTKVINIRGYFKAICHADKPHYSLPLLNASANSLAEICPLRSLSTLQKTCQYKESCDN